MSGRYVTDPASALARTAGSNEPESTPFGLEWEEVDGRHDPEQRFALYRLCECWVCGGTGKTVHPRCSHCRGEGKVRELLATCATPEAVGVSLVTLAREGEWAECPLGLLDRQGEKGQKWLILPWLPSARNVSDAGRVLGSARRKVDPDYRLIYNQATPERGTMNAERVTIESDEDGFELHITRDEGPAVLVVNIQSIDLDAFYDQVKGRIGPYLQERDSARLEFLCNPDESAGMAEAYALSDPKHPDFHSVHTDIWDARAGK